MNVLLLTILSQVHEMMKCRYMMNGSTHLCHEINKCKYQDQRWQTFS